MQRSGHVFETRDLGCGTEKQVENIFITNKTATIIENIVLFDVSTYA